MFKRGKYWQIRDANGNRVSSGTADQEAAQALESRYQKERWARRHMPELYREVDSRPTKTIKDACFKWLKDHQHQSNFKASGTYFDFWMGKYGNDCLLGDINRNNADDIIKYRTTDEPSKQNATANNYVHALKKVLISAASEWHTKEDPWYVGETPSFKYYPILGHRERVLSVAEWMALSGSLEQDLADMAEFSLATLCRETNVFGLTPVHTREKAIFFPAAEMKKRKPHSIPLNLTAQAVLERRLKEHPVIGNGRIFNFRGKAIDHLQGWTYQAWLRGVKKAGIDHVTFHDLRRTGASWLARAGVDGDIIDRLGAWKPKGVRASVYSHFDVDSLRPHMHIIDTVLAGAVNATENQVVAIR